MVDIGSGLAIDEQTGEMIIVDRRRVERELAASADPCDRAVAAMADGDHQRAAVELAAAPASLRRDALQGELARVSGDVERAIAMFTRLLDELPATVERSNGLRRATLLQHLGKAEYAAGRHRAAVQHLQSAVSLRRCYHAPEDQRRSSELMLTLVARALSGTAATD